MSNSFRPSFNSSNIKIALRHPSLILALLGGADSPELQRRFAKMTLFEEMYSLLGETRKRAQEMKPLQGSADERLKRLGEICSPLARADTRKRGDAYYTALYLLVREFKPATVIETGVWWGSSSMFLLQAMEDNGQGELYSVDEPNVSYTCSPSHSHSDIIPSKEDTGAIVPGRLRARWHLQFGKSQDRLPALMKELGTVDIFIHDSEHTVETMLYEYDLAWDHLEVGGLLVSDDTDWNDAFSRFVTSKRSAFHEYEKYAKNRFGIAPR